MNSSGLACVQVKYTIPSEIVYFQEEVLHVDMIMISNCFSIFLAMSIFRNNLDRKCSGSFMRYFTECTNSDNGPSSPILSEKWEWKLMRKPRINEMLLAVAFDQFLNKSRPVGGVRCVDHGHTSTIPARSSSAWASFRKASFASSLWEGLPAFTSWIGTPSNCDAWPQCRNP